MPASSLVHRKLSVILTSVALAAPLLAQDNPLARSRSYVGTYAGEGINLVLSTGDAVNKYSGTLNIDGKAYSCTGEVAGGAFQGNFAVEGKQFPFTATLADGGIDLTSAGTTHRLKRAGEPENPLAGPRVAPAPGPAPIPVPVPPPGPNVPQPPQPNAGEGGVGIGFEPGPDGSMMITRIMPGGAAEKAGVKPGGKLVAVNGKSVAGLSFEQLRGVIMGPVGSQITLLVETETEIMDIILIRAPLPQAPNQPGPQPEPGPMPAPMPGPRPTPGNEPRPTPLQPGVNPLGQAPVPNTPVTSNTNFNPANPDPRAFNPRAANGGAVSSVFPAWMKPGTNVTFWAGSATIPGANTVLTQDPNGNWVDPQGNRFSPADSPGAGGYGFSVMSILDTTNTNVAVETRMYTVLEPQTGNAMFMSSTGYVGTAETLGDYWIHPAKLAREQEMNQNGVRIARMQYPLNNKMYNAIAFETKNDKGYSRTTYDLDTGLLIAAGSSTIVNAGYTPNPNGTTAAQSSSTMITQTFLVDVRETKIPWAGDPLPNWIATGAQLNFAGTYSIRVQGIPEVPQQISLNIAFDKQIGAAISAKQNTYLMPFAGGQPQQSTADRCLSNNSLMPPFLAPQRLAALRPNEVLDEDPKIKRRVFFAGVQGNVAAIVDQGPLDTLQFYYDVRSGQLVGINNELKQGIGITTTNLQLANGR